jgi:hypothetical protein
MPADAVALRGRKDGMLQQEIYTGFRLVPARFAAKQKLSQDKPDAVIERATGLPR